MIKAVFADIDYTLTDSNRNISEITVNSIKRCANKGIEIILTSGRSRMEMMNRQKEIGASHYIISSNGADVYDIKKQKEIFSENLEKDDIKRLLQYSIEKDYQIRFIYEDKFITNKIVFPDEKHKVVSLDEIKQIIENKKIVQCVICDRDLERQKNLKNYVENNFTKLEIVNESKRLTDSNAKPTKIYYCDITLKDISKGKSILKICEYLKIKPEEIITIGDSENDLSMFEVTPNSVAMGNAVEEVKNKANYVTLSNDDNGVAEVLNRLQKLYVNIKVLNSL